MRNTYKIDDYRRLPTSNSLWPFGIYGQPRIYSQIAQPCCISALREFGTKVPHGGLAVIYR
jgi:hypothetical protein